MTACFFDCIGLIIYMYIQETLLSYTAVKHPRYLVQSALKLKSKLNFIVINETAKKWAAKVCFHVWSYGNFCLLDLCLHNQIVQDGISSSVN